MSKYIDADKLFAEIDRRKVILDKYKDSFETAACCKQELEWMKDFISSLQEESEIVEFSFKGGTYRVNGEEHALKGGKAKVIILEINQEEE